MRSPQNINTPAAPANYDPNNEQSTRRSVENAYQTLRADVESARDIKDNASSLALRRHQFLLMGASNG